MTKQICQIFVQAITMRHVMSGFHFVLADFSDLNTVVQHTIQSTQGSSAFILSLLLISLV